jgi:hypothetical protein
MRESGAMLHFWEDRAREEALIVQELAPITSCCRHRVLVNGRLVRENPQPNPIFFGSGEVVQ